MTKPTGHRCGPEWLDAKLAADEVVILDGAMGTELQARGVPMDGNAWSGAAQLSHPETVRQTHLDYIRAGADVIITNTFSSGRHMLEPAGFADQVVESNTRAVQLAIEARDQVANRPVAIAGSICEWVHVESRWLEPENLRKSIREQADLLKTAGVDLIALEMCERPEPSALAVEAALETGLPVWVGISCRRMPGKARLVTFDAPHHDFAELVERLAKYDIAAMNVMHSPIADIAEAMKIVREHWQGPLGIYPESGHFIMPHWQFVDVISPEDLVVEARKWRGMGASLIGGCCGLGPDHIAALKQALA